MATSERIFNLGVEADVRIRQQFVAADTTADQFGSPLALTYSNVALDLGRFFSEFFDPTVQALQIALAPIEPVVDFLTLPIPVLSDIGESVGYGSVTPIDLGILTTRTSSSPAARPPGPLPTSMPTSTATCRCRS